jgi:5'-nucleotidase
MKRRDFIKNTAASSALIGFSGLTLSSFDTKNLKHITILHTNDVHSYIDPFPADHPKNPNMGGVARRASLIEAIRTENPNTLVVDAGDIFQGTPYFNYYGGELEFRLMSLMKYDFATLGNHDFDNGLEGLFAQLPHAKFEFLSSNYDFRNTLLEGHIKPYSIRIIDGIKIGLFGIGIQLDGLVDKKNYKEIVYNNPIEIATDISNKLKNEEKCDLVICLSHLGLKYKDDVQKISDVVLAKKTKNIDLIIGGHTHSFLEKPIIEQNLDNKEVLINQVGCYGINIGRIDFYLTKDKKVMTNGKSITV